MTRMTFLSICFSILLCCSRQVPVNNIQNEPRLTDGDQAFANVYQGLEGEWQGQFHIYEDTVRAEIDRSLLTNITSKSLSQLPLKHSSTIDVKQVYQSTSPFFQTVVITDFYPDNNQTVTSRGVNKVQDGKMWCVVEKPDETIIHEGSLENEKTIIWQRSKENPQRVEYFRETVETQTYEIVGWGYYEGDDLEKMPRFWFYGLYRRPAD